MSDIRVGAVGVQLVVPVKDQDGTAIDVSTATARTVRLKKPGRAGTVLVKDAVNDTDGVNGLIRYTTQDGDLSVAGVWRIQGYVELPGGQKWPTDETEFLVEPNLD